MTLMQLRYVAEIAERGSMNEAAKAMYVAQPTMSATIKELEKELGFKIFARNNRGMMLSPEGVEFLSYARAILDQADVLNRRYFGEDSSRATLSISTQHYGFVTEAFLNWMPEIASGEWKLALKEQRTEEIIADIKAFHSDLGIIYINSKNERMMNRYLKENHLEFTPLYRGAPHVLLSKNDELAKEKELSLEDLREYTYLYFEQKDNDPVYFSEEVVSNLNFPRKIAVSDRATIFSFLEKMKSYTVSTAMASKGRVEKNVVSIPLKFDADMIVGYVKLGNANLSPLATRFLEHLKEEFY